MCGPPNQHLAPPSCWKPVTRELAIFRAMNSPGARAFPYTLKLDAIPTRKIVPATPSAAGVTRVRYECPACCFESHNAAWRAAIEGGNLHAPEPVCSGHEMFEFPQSYGCEAIGDGCSADRWTATEGEVRAALAGWERMLPAEKLDALVHAMVTAKLVGAPMESLADLSRQSSRARRNTAAAYL